MRIDPQIPIFPSFSRKKVGSFGEVPQTSTDAFISQCITVGSQSWYCNHSMSQCSQCNQWQKGRLWNSKSVFKWAEDAGSPYKNFSLFIFDHASWYSQKYFVGNIPRVLPLSFEIVGKLWRKTRRPAISLPLWCVYCPPLFLVISPIWSRMSSFFSTHRPPNIPCSKPSPIPWKWWTISNYIAYFQLGTYSAAPKRSTPNSQGTKNIWVSENEMSSSHGYFTITLVSKIIIKWGFRGYSISQ